MKNLPAFDEIPQKGWILLEFLMDDFKKNLRPFIVQNFDERFLDQYADEEYRKGHGRLDLREKDGYTFSDGCHLPQRLRDLLDEFADMKLVTLEWGNIPPFRRLFNNMSLKDVIDTLGAKVSTSQPKGLTDSGIVQIELPGGGIAFLEALRNDHPRDLQTLLLGGLKTLNLEWVLITKKGRRLLRRRRLAVGAGCEPFESDGKKSAKGGKPDKKSKPPGRPRASKEDREADEKLFKAWEAAKATGTRTYAEFCRDRGKSEDPSEIKDAIGRHRKRLERESDGQNTPVNHI